jgi:hypothetical protein
MTDQTDPSILEEITAIARADHAYGMQLRDNPYPEGTDRAEAWTSGWRAEADAVHQLDEEMSKLPEFRVRVQIVDGLEEGRHDRLTGTPLAEIDRDDWDRYTVTERTRIGDLGVTFRSREAEAAFPDRPVWIRAEYETQRAVNA